MIDRTQAEYILKLQPRVTERRCGGFLALSPKESPFQIGVTGDTRDEAIAKFHISHAGWIETALSDVPLSNRLRYSDA